MHTVLRLIIFYIAIMLHKSPTFGACYTDLVERLQWYPYTIDAVITFAQWVIIHYDLHDFYIERRVWIQTCQHYINFLKYRDSIKDELFFTANNLTSALPSDLSEYILKKYLANWQVCFIPIDLEATYRQESKRMKAVRKRIINSAIEKSRKETKQTTTKQKYK